MRPSHPVRHLLPLRNQRFFCSRFRSGLLVERLGMPTRLTPIAFAAVSLLAEALARHGNPQIFNTDQGSQFTCHSFTDVLVEHQIAISMDGRGSWRDNVFLERFWRSIKYEEVYLRAYDSVDEARASLSRYIHFYNGHRPHSSLDGRTPDQAYFNSLPFRAAA
jgi:putative transposase